MGGVVYAGKYSHSVENQHILVCAPTSTIEFVETLAQNCSYQALGATRYLQAEVSNSLF